jgi:hypothetical protein
MTDTSIGKQLMKYVEMALKVFSFLLAIIGAIVFAAWTSGMSLCINCDLACKSRVEAAQQQEKSHD